jgi:2-methylcitrate dehydratase PrpD
VSCLLAKYGYKTIPTLFDGDDGYWTAMGSGKPDYDALTHQLGEKWWITESAIKPYPSCRFNHNPIEMYKKIVEEHNIQPEEIVSITLKTIPRIADKKLQWAETEPRDAYGAAFSIPHCIAMAAYNVRIGPEWQTSENIRDPKIKKFRKKVKLTPDPKAHEKMIEQKEEGFPREIPVRMEIALKDKVYREERLVSKGDPWTSETELTDVQLEEKFSMNASNVFDDSRIRAIIELIGQLEKMENIHELIKLLVR